MRVLIGCESSGIVRGAFAKRGFDAWSCDLLPTEIPGNHYQCDVREVWQGFDLIILHPPCTHISISGAAHFEAKRKDGRQQEAIEFFMDCVVAPSMFLAIENPIGIMSSLYQAPSQIIQPFQYGHDASKSTCLWLKNLPLLRPTKYAPPRMVGNLPRWGNQTDSGQNALPPTADRWKIRSQTYQGVADAMAQQWGDFISKYKNNIPAFRATQLNLFDYAQQQ